MSTSKAHKRNTPVKEQTGKAVFKAHQEGGINVGHLSSFAREATCKLSHKVSVYVQKVADLLTLRSPSL